jgi:hypothetical protein
MTEEQAPLPERFSRFIVRTNVNVAMSDIRPIVRAQLKTLRREIVSAQARMSGVSRYHLDDSIERIDSILDPK